MSVYLSPIYEYAVTFCFYADRASVTAIYVPGTNVGDGLEDIRWIRGLGGEKLPAAPYALLQHLKKGLFFAIGEA